MDVIEFDCLDSTNEYLKREWRNISDEICFVRANMQLSGKGRLKREWISGQGGLWFSVMVNRPVKSPFFYQKAMSLAICDVLKSNVNNEFRIKWPNDVYLNYKKVCGILQENIYESNLSAVIIGAGININNQIPSELAAKAISISSVVNMEVEVPKIFSEITKDFIDKLNKNEVEIDGEWMDRSLVKIGQKVEVYSEEDGLGITGEVVENPFEKLKIVTQDGILREFYAGDVRLVRF